MTFPTQYLPCEFFKKRIAEQDAYICDVFARVALREITHERAMELINSALAVKDRMVHLLEEESNLHWIVKI